MVQMSDSVFTERGKDFGAYTGDMPRASQRGFRARFEAAGDTVNQDVIQRWQDQVKRSRGLNLVVFSEGWCGDCRFNVPYVAYLASVVQGLELRCFSRDEDGDLFKGFFPNSGKIPSILVFTEDWREIGRWVERPEPVRRILEVGDEDRIREMRVKYAQGAYANAVLQEILALAQSSSLMSPARSD